jgi:hypothetical protein
MWFEFLFSPFSPSLISNFVTVQVFFDLTAEVAENAEKSVDRFQIADCRFSVWQFAIYNLQSTRNLCELRVLCGK